MTPVESILKPQIVSAFDVERIRADFPILKLKVDGKPLIYLDSAASGQMPQPVIDRLVSYQTIARWHDHRHRVLHRPW